MESSNYFSHKTDLDCGTNSGDHTTAAAPALVVLAVANPDIGAGNVDHFSAAVLALPGVGVLRDIGLDTQSRTEGAEGIENRAFEIGGNSLSFVLTH